MKYDDLNHSVYECYNTDILDKMPYKPGMWVGGWGSIIHPCSSEYVSAVSATDELLKRCLEWK
jgi:hypothetical protein